MCTGVPRHTHRLPGSVPQEHVCLSFEDCCTVELKRGNPGTEEQIRPRRALECRKGKTRPLSSSLPRVVTIHGFQVLLSSITHLLSYPIVKVAQSCPTLCDPMDCTLHGILQARILEWVSLSLPQGIFPNQGSNPGHPHCGQTLY